MKKLLAIVLSAVCLLSFSACDNDNISSKISATTSLITTTTTTEPTSTTITEPTTTTTKKTTTTTKKKTTTTKKKTTTTTTTTTTKSTTTTTTTTTATKVIGISYLMNPNSMIVHRESCPTVKKPENYYETHDLNYAFNCGYRACKVCKP